MATRDQRPYGISLPIQRGDSGYFGATYDVVEQIKMNLGTFLRTKKGERRMNPGFGSNLWGAVFEFNDDELTPIIENIIRTDVESWMPQLNINDIKVVSTSQNRDTYRVDVSIIFTIEVLGITTPQTLKISIDQPSL